MELYHGSNVSVEKPKVLSNGHYKDFGYGFYCTNFEHQARKWALTRKHRHIVNVYEYTEDSALNILKFSEMTEEGLRIYTEQRAGFSRAYDISSSLATRKLESHLTILGTIGGVAPFLGLFGTVVRILYTFQDLATQGNQSAAVAMGIGSALIATAFGLGVAIVAVVFYNSFQSIVKRYEDDFQLIKLLFLSFVDSEEESNKTTSNVSL